MNKESTLQDRLGSTRNEEGSAAPLAVRAKLDSGEIRYVPPPPASLALCLSCLVLSSVVIMLDHTSGSLSVFSCLVLSCRLS